RRDREADDHHPREHGARADEAASARRAQCRCRPAQRRAEPSENRDHAAFLPARVPGTMTTAAVEASAPTASRGWPLTAIRLRLGLVTLLVALAAIAWWWTAHEMRGMDDGPWTGLGGLGWFVSIWVVMMAAMMFPSVSPTVALYSRLTARRSPLPGLAFAGGYLATWAAAGVVAYGIAVAGGHVAHGVLTWD